MINSETCVSDSEIHVSHLKTILRGRLENLRGRRPNNSNKRLSASVGPRSAHEEHAAAAASISARCKSRRKRKSLLPLIAPVRCYPSLWRLCRCPSGTGLSTAIMPAPSVVAPTIVALDHLHQELSAVSADVAHDSFHATVPSTPLLRVVTHNATMSRNQWVVSDNGS